MLLTFVYNADSGFMNTLIDSAHKVLHPETYACGLCALTHGMFGERLAWKDFRARHANVGMEFLHRDEFERANEKSLTYPVILKDGGVLLNAEDLAGLSSLDALIKRLEQGVHPNKGT